MLDSVFADLAAAEPRPAAAVVEVGRCSRWLRPHRTRWTADGGFAWPVGYGTGGDGHAREGLPQFDWSVRLALAGSTWTESHRRGDRPSVRVAVPARTTRHAQAAIHTVWATGREPERRFYGFRRRDGAWQCTAASEWASDRPAWPAPPVHVPAVAEPEEPAIEKPIPYCLSLWNDPPEVRRARLLKWMENVAAFTRFWADRDRGETPGSGVLRYWCGRCREWSRHDVDAGGHMATCPHCENRVNLRPEGQYGGEYDRS